ncbi:MAG: accessory gene regulator B family protein [Clostridia bacterium]
MIEKMSIYILDNLLYKNEKVEGDQRDIMLFGITRIIEDVPKYSAIFLICLFLNILKEAGIVLLITILYKSFTGGAHARSNITCFITSTIFFVTPVLLAKYIIIPQSVIYILYGLLFIFSLYVIIKRVPADTEEVPVINKNKRKKMRAFATSTLILIYIFVIFFLNNIIISKLILITLFYINLFTTKPMYRLFKCKYSYESDEFKEYFQN